MSKRTDIQPTTAANVQLIDGGVVLIVRTILTDGPERYSVVEQMFDIDAYALELARTLINVVVEQKHSEGVA